jgi:hypothetical protein
MSEELQGQNRSAVGKLLHMMRWTRSEILNSVRTYLKSMKYYCVATPTRGLLLKPKGTWNGDQDYELEVDGYPDTNYATDVENRRSISEYSVFVCKAPVSMKNRQQKTVMLSTAEAELVAATQCAQDMLCVMRVLESVGLKVKKPMQLYCDAHKWRVGGRTRHVEVGGRTRQVEVRQYLLRKLQEEKIIHTQWISGDDTPSDLLSKNLTTPLFERHARRYDGWDEYMKRAFTANPQDGA